jgi:hypothetical protein
MLASNANPRCVKIILDKTKNDPLGTGPVANRTHLILCYCATYLDGKQKAAFMRLCSADKTGMASPCVCATCPYKYLVDYINLIPETSGEHRFLRALSNGCDPKFLISPYGESSLREIPKLWNNILPEDLKVAKPTGHSGRTTGVSIAMNNGGDSCKVKMKLFYSVHNYFSYEMSLLHVK